jgi:alkylation response protein AidB-like acyl-CoA dehydrogenase
MLFHPTGDQRDLIDEAFARPLDDLLPLERLHKANGAEPWDDLAGLGLFGIAAPEAMGGVGLSAVEEMLLAVELGKRLAGPQVTATLMAFHCADADLQTRIAIGTARVAPALIVGDELHLHAAEGADHILVRKGGEAGLIDAAALGNRRLLDGEHWTATIEAVALPPVIAWASAEAVRRVRLIEAAALGGAAQRACEMGVEYAKIREQFGHPIGGFQAVKHHCANMAMAARAATDQASFAAVAIDQSRADAAFQVEAALLLAIDAALANARANVQIHGGMGFSEEADPHLIVKRAHLLIEAAGGSEAATERVARADPPMRH